jgi:hypothetical protein
LATQRDQDGVPVYWVTDQRGIKLARPVWENSFKKNWAEWGEALMRIFRIQAKKHTSSKFLLKQSAEAVRDRIKDSTWISYRSNGVKKAQGTFEQERVKKNVSTLENNRQKDVSGWLI